MSRWGGKISWWRHQMDFFPHYWPFVRGITGPRWIPRTKASDAELRCFLWCASVWINSWVNNHEASDLRRYRTHYDVIVIRREKMKGNIWSKEWYDMGAMSFQITGISPVVLNSLCKLWQKENFKASWHGNIFYITASFWKRYTGNSLTKQNKTELWRFPSYPPEQVFFPQKVEYCWELRLLKSHGPLARYVNLRVAYAPGMPRTFSPPPRVSDSDIHHGTCATHVPWCMPGSLTRGLLWNWWRGNSFRHSRRMRKPRFYVSGRRTMWRRPNASLSWCHSLVHSSSLQLVVCNSHNTDRLVSVLFLCLSSWLYTRVYCMSSICTSKTISLLHMVGRARVYTTICWGNIVPSVHLTGAFEKIFKIFQFIEHVLYIITRTMLIHIAVCDYILSCFMYHSFIWENDTLS